MVLKSEMISCIVCETEKMDITKHIEINHLTGDTQVTFHGLETEQLLTKAECWDSLTRDESVESAEIFLKGW